MSKQNNKNLEHENPVLHLKINDNTYDWPHQYILGAEVRKLGKISINDEIYLAIERPWEDEHVLDSTKVDLARIGVEHFYSKKKDEHHLVHIHINDIERSISRGKHTVSEIKAIGEVPLIDLLDELIDGKLVRLPDDGSVLVKGCELFFSRVRGGTSS